MILTWTGEPPETCNICKKPIKDQFIDGNTVLGSWANMCPDCHGEFGTGLGTGRGQHYKRMGREFIKIGG